MLHRPVGMMRTMPYDHFIERSCDKSTVCTIDQFRYPIPETNFMYILNQDIST